MDDPWGCLQLSGPNSKWENLAGNQAEQQRGLNRPSEIRRSCGRCLPLQPPVQPGDAALLFAFAVIHSAVRPLRVPGGEADWRPGPAAAVRRAQHSIGRAG